MLRKLLQNGEATAEEWRRARRTLSWLQTARSSTDLISQNYLLGISFFHTLRRGKHTVPHFQRGARLPRNKMQMRGQREIVANTCFQEQHSLREVSWTTA